MLAGLVPAIHVAPRMRRSHRHFAMQHGAACAEAFGRVRIDEGPAPALGPDLELVANQIEVEAPISR